jgi:REP element-mobilizing transposase RayT
MFELFDPQDDVRITSGNLPHWYQPGVTYFVTFRTDDSLPNEVSERWHRERDDWLRRHGINPLAADWKASFSRLPNSQQYQFHKTISEEYLALLDKGHGECALRRRELAQIVATSLSHFDGQRYYLGDFVVMPNHVHLLVGLVGDTDIEKQCYSWKKFTAGQINRSLGRRGRFWQEECFDHFVRSADHFERFRHYIAENGPKARLRPDEYLYVSSRHTPCAVALDSKRQPY